MIPLLPLRDVVVYPHMVIPLFVGREKSIEALERAMNDNKQILLAAQKSADIDSPTIDDIHTVGTLATILQLLKLPDGTIKVLVEGNQRVAIQQIEDNEGLFSAQADIWGESDEMNGKELDVLSRSTISLFEQYVKLNKKIPPEILTSLAGMDEASRLADSIAAQMSLKLEDKQKLLEMRYSGDRLEFLIALIEGELDLLNIEKRIRGRVKQQMEKSQREYYLNEQMKAIQKELGDMGEEPNEIEAMLKQVNESGMHKEAAEKAESELNKLKMMSPMSAEATVVRNYIETLLLIVT